MENHPPQNGLALNSAPEQQIADLVNVDVRARGHRPDGKFLSAYEMAQIGDNQELIRDSLSERKMSAAVSTGSLVLSETVSFTDTEESGQNAEDNIGIFEALEDIAIVGEMPTLDSSETKPGKLDAMRSFFSNRKLALKKMSDRTNSVLQSNYGKNVAGVEITASQWFRSRFSPAQLKNNALTNLAPLNGKPHSYDKVVDNPVIRKAFYEKAIDGDLSAYKYLKANDPNFGKREMTMSEAAMEAAAIFSGVAAVRKIGRYALAGVIFAKANLENDPVKFAGHVSKLEKIVEKEKYSIGAAKFEKEKAAYEGLPKKFNRDPFSRAS